MAKTRRLVQVAAFPYRWRNQCLQVLLVTSKRTKRWVVPKGGFKPGLAAHQVAAEEAFEEGGVEGRTGRRCIGSFIYPKVGSRRTAWCTVLVYPLRVTREHRDWPERRLRRRLWMPFPLAERQVKEKGLKRLIRAQWLKWNGGDVYGPATDQPALIRRAPRPSSRWSP